jgi:predicted enzyme related to lactoylglutathione lyase
MDRNPVGWFEIYVKDMPRAKAFYEAVFDAKLTKLESTAGAAGGLVRMEGGPAGGGASTIIYFVTDDCTAELSRVTANGGSVKKPKSAIGPNGFIALVQDTEGNVIGLHSLK